MAKNQLKITSDVSELQNGLAKAQAEILKLRDKMKDVTAASKEGSTASAAGFDVMGRAAGDVTDKIKSLVLQYTSIGAAIGVVSSAYAEWQKRMEEVYTKAKERNAALRADLFATGRIADGVAIRAAIRETVASGKIKTTDDQLQAAFSGVISDSPTMDTWRAMDIAKETSRASSVYTNKEDLTTLGRRAGRIGDALPGKSANDVLDIAHAIQARIGPDDAAKLDSREYLAATDALVSSSALSPEQAMGFGAALIKKDLPVSLAERMATQITGTMAKKKGVHGRAMSGEDAAWNRIAKLASPADRLQALLSDDEAAKAVLGDRVSGRLGRITMGDINAEGQYLVDAQKNDLFAASLEKPLAKEGEKGVARAQLKANQDANLTPQAKSFFEAKADRDLKFREESNWLDAFIRSRMADFGESQRLTWGLVPDGQSNKELVKAVTTATNTNAATNARNNGTEGGR